MSARYQFLVSDELIVAWNRDRLPPGLRILEVSDLDVRTRCHTVTVDDLDAPEALTGQMTWPLWRIEGDGSVLLVGRDSV